MPCARLAQLRREIRHHEERYYIDNAPEISDEAFDGCCTSSSALEAEHPDLVTPDSPTQRVAGQPTGSFPTVEHMAPMLSLDNAYSADELRAFDERVRRGAGLGDSPGRLRRRAQDRRVEHRADLRGWPAGPRSHARRRRPRRRRDPQRPDDPRDSAVAAGRDPRAAIEVRGEVYLPRASFERINREREDAGEPLFQNPRNAAAGTMRNLDPALVARRGLSAFVYQLVAGDLPAEAGSDETAREGSVAPGESSTASGESPVASGFSRKIVGSGREPTHAETLRDLVRWGLPVERHWQLCDGIDAVMAFCDEWADKRLGTSTSTPTGSSSR